jgi:Ala-tRNA(Pro) deacylase
LLDRRRVPYQEVHHAEAFTAQEVAQHEHFTGRRVAKVVIAMADGHPVELVLPANRRVVLDRLRELLGAPQLRLATEEEMERYFTDCERGAVPPLRHWKGVDVLMDSSLQVAGEILFQAGTHTDAVRLRFDDWFQLAKPRVESFSEPAEAAPRTTDPNAGGSAAAAAELTEFLGDLLAALHLQAKEIERLQSHVEQQTIHLAEPSQMPLVVSELSELQTRLKHRRSQYTSGS